MTSLMTSHFITQSVTNAVFLVYFLYPMAAASEACDPPVPDPPISTECRSNLHLNQQQQQKCKQLVYPSGKPPIRLKDKGLPRI